MGLWQLTMMFGDGSSSFNIIFLKVKNLSEFLIFLSRLLQSITVDEKYEFINKCMFIIDLKNIADVSCSVCNPNDGDITEYILGRLGFS